jgi:hypothetical protein
MAIGIVKGLVRGQRQQRAKETEGARKRVTRTLNQQDGKEELAWLVVGKLCQLYICSAPRDHTVPLHAVTSG